MKLLWSPRSPFARKVTVAAHELGIADRIELERATVADDLIDPAVSRWNPLNQIPTLICRPDDIALFDSSVIVSFLNAEFGGTLIPDDDRLRRQVRRLEVVGDGLSQLNRRRRMELLRPDNSDPGLLRALAAKTAATLDWLDEEIRHHQDVSIGCIAVAVALGHLDFRFPDEGWRVRRSRLHRWFSEFSDRPSMQATLPAES